MPFICCSDSFTNHFYIRCLTYSVNSYTRLLSEIYLVRVERKYLLLGQARFENDRHVRFGDLSLVCWVVRQKEVLNKLLSD